MSQPNVDEQTFCDLAIELNYNAKALAKRLRKLYPDYKHREIRVQERINSLRKRGLLALESGNKVSTGEVLKGTSTLYDENGQVKRQWVKTDVPRSNFLDQFTEAISELAETLSPLPEISPPVSLSLDDLATLYISNDVHFGAYMWHGDTEADWNVEIASNTIKSAYDYLFECSPSSKVGIVCDLGDLLEVDDYKNMTPKSGNILDVDSRYPKILRAAYEALIYAIQKALTKHELVYFYNIAGNHDISSGDAIREVIRVAFMNNPRVIVDETPKSIKYHQHGNVLLQFAHGDGMRMREAGEVMAVDMQHIFSETKHRFAHFGHTHKDAVIDSRICRSESHRNIAPLNTWAFNHGYRRSLGTMKSLTYHTAKGEVSRQIYNVELDEPIQ